MPKRVLTVSDAFTVSISGVPPPLLVSITRNACRMLMGEMSLAVVLDIFASENGYALSRSVLPAYATTLVISRSYLSVKSTQRREGPLPRAPSLIHGLRLYSPAAFRLPPNQATVASTPSSVRHRTPLSSRGRAAF